MTRSCVHVGANQKTSFSGTRMKRVALVTGGGRGIGREICRVLAAAGHAVAAADIDEASARDTAASLPGEG
ncbi:SDR family NAD(P)-dependent oxidoreductase, partial [Stenotrophomonas maltophilia]|uniref:SDR family NAD(P)-dependent oxidoreductase n=1 Tax=Stenotrophomonas maltophilia TaxID=40324 RepID=UPI0031B72E15